MNVARFARREHAAEHATEMLVRLDGIDRKRAAPL
jgi:hypothetical protein